MEPLFDVAVFLAGQREAILERSSAAVTGRNLPHYEAAGSAALARQLAELFDVVVAAAADRHLDAALVHADAIAAARHQTGHDLSELQRAINSLEEQCWQAVIADAPPNAQGYALGVISTILGAMKDRVACAYVSRAASAPTHSLRIDELFRGAAAGQA